MIENPYLHHSFGRGPEMGVRFFTAFVPKIIWLLLLIGVLVFVFTFLWGAIEWMLAGGDQQKVQQARNRVVNSFWGLAILFFLFAIIKLIGSMFGLRGFEKLRLEIPKIGGQQTNLWQSPTKKGGEKE